MASLLLGNMLPLEMIAKNTLSDQYMHRVWGGKQRTTETIAYSENLRAAVFVDLKSIHVISAVTDNQAIRLRFLSKIPSLWTTTGRNKQTNENKQTKQNKIQFMKSKNIYWVRINYQVRFLTLGVQNGIRHRSVPCLPKRFKVLDDNGYLWF